MLGFLQPPAAYFPILSCKDEEIKYAQLIGFSELFLCSDNGTRCTRLADVASLASFFQVLWLESKMIYYYRYFYYYAGEILALTFSGRQWYNLTGDIGHFVMYGYQSIFKKCLYNTPYMSTAVIKFSEYYSSFPFFKMSQGLSISWSWSYYSSQLRLDKQCGLLDLLTILIST